MFFDSWSLVLASENIASEAREAQNRVLVGVLVNKSPRTREPMYPNSCNGFWNCEPKRILMQYESIPPPDAPIQEQKTPQLGPLMPPNPSENWKLSDSDSFQFNFDLIFHVKLT